MQYDPPIYTMAKAIEYPIKIHDTSQYKNTQALMNKFRHNYDVTNFKSNYSN